VGKKQQKLSEAAAAVYVITQEDIRRSGVTSIPEALRMAPGLDVARIDSSTWAVSARGFNGQYSSKMLVLVDGRSVYTPLFSGVYWDTVDLPLEDIERIEVIRGPGATMWGANAVNGVINIISKRARGTQGGLVSTGAGNEEEGFGGFRYGGRLGPKAYYRVYSKYFQRSDLLTPTGLSAADEWHTARGGFRMDWDPSDKDSVTVEGDLHGGRNGQPLRTFVLASPYSQAVDGQIHSTGGDVLTRWRRTFSPNSEMELQLSYGRTDRRDVIFREVRDTVQADFQHRFTLTPRHEILWGLAYQFTTDQVDGTDIATLNPNQRGTDLYSAFAQDEVTLAPDRLRLALGSKLEHNDYTGFEFEPSVQ
jgi:iron complex outermembrane receptor protein